MCGEGGTGAENGKCVTVQNDEMMSKLPDGPRLHNRVLEVLSGLDRDVVPAHREGAGALAGDGDLVPVPTEAIDIEVREPEEEDKIKKNKIKFKTQRGEEGRRPPVLAYPRPDSTPPR